MSPIKKKHLTNFYTAKKAFLLFPLVLLFMNLTHGQQSLRDSLKMELKHSRPSLHSTLQDSSFINTLNELAFAMRFHKGDSLLTLANEAFNHSELVGYTYGKISAHIGIGDFYSDKGIHEKGVFHYSKALEIAEELQINSLILFAHNCLAGEYEYQGDYANALEEMLEGIEIAERLNNEEQLSIFNENMALLYAKQNDYDEAIKYLKIAKRLNDKINDELHSAQTCANMASVYADAHQYEYAMFNANKSIKILEKYEVMEWLAFAYETKGKTYLRQGKYKWASRWYHQSEMLHNKSVDDEREKINLLQGLAETNLGLLKDSISEAYAQNALVLSNKLSVKEGIRDASKTLYILNKKKNDYAKALEYHELFEQLSDTLAQNESKKSLLMLKTRINHEKQKESLILVNEQALAEQKNYVTGIFGLVLVLLVITFLVKRSEHIQKNLNKELTSKKSQLEEHEKELLEINETKDKLFSIIGHDLRGPIGAFQGLLQMFKKGDIEQKDFLSFIPKINVDIDHISFTLNNLLSWGQTQMNGMITRPAAVNLKNIVSENVNLLSEIASVKSIQVTNKVEVDTLVWSDADQIDIVVRNLISNALKFTPKNGSITISAFEKNEHWEVSIQDTGVGMDQATQDSIFAKNSNITTYGTDNEKGTGLGLTLCKEMVENNKGIIWVNSILDQGTCFKFTVPKSKKIYEQAS